MAWWNLGVLVGVMTAAVVRRLFMRRSRLCPNGTTMAGKTVIVTGAGGGLGKETAVELARRKARVIVACRDIAAADKAAQHVSRVSGNSDTVAKALDLSSFNSIRSFCNQILSEEERIDVLVNNAGVFQCPYTKTEDGLEMQMGVNHFGHFLLTSMLIERLKESAPSRVVVVSSALSSRGDINLDDINSEKSYDKMKAYADSKLANLMFTQELGRRLDGSGVSVIAMHPGMVATNLGRHVVSRPLLVLLSPLAVLLGLRDAYEGSQSIVFCCCAKEFEKQYGIYVSKVFKQIDFPKNAVDTAKAQQLWELSEKMTESKLS